MRARPETMNAFELITLSQGLDLGVLFQSRHDMVNRTTRFASRRQPEEIVARLKVAAKELQFSVHVKNFKVCLRCIAGQTPCVRRLRHFFLQCLVTLAPALSAHVSSRLNPILLLCCACCRSS